MSDKLELERAAIAFNRGVENPSVSISVGDSRINYNLYPKKDGIFVSRLLGSADGVMVSWNDLIHLMEEKHPAQYFYHDIAPYKLIHPTIEKATAERWGNK